MLWTENSHEHRFALRGRWIFIAQPKKHIFGHHILFVQNLKAVRLSAGIISIQKIHTVDEFLYQSCYRLRRRLELHVEAKLPSDRAPQSAQLADQIPYSQ